jgi:hypothetical protein
MAFLGVVGNAVFFRPTDLVFEADDLFGTLYINGVDICAIGVFLE